MEKYFQERTFQYFIHDNFLMKLTIIQREKKKHKYSLSTINFMNPIRHYDSSYRVLLAERLITFLMVKLLIVERYCFRPSKEALFVARRTYTYENILIT